MKKIVIIGGGFFGCYLALQLKTKENHVSLLESEDEIMTRASFTNQARVHGGYHYPRSILTALRSRESFSRFCAEFSDCIDDEFENYYMVSKRQSHVTSKQFETFCSRIGAPCESAGVDVKSLVNDIFIEDIFRTQEYCFNSTKIKIKMEKLLVESGVEINTSSTFTGMAQNADNDLDVKYTFQGSESTLKSNDHVFNCTYSNINIINLAASVPFIPLRHEITEVVLVDVPDVLQRKALTVMDGPFFSIIPFPAKGCYSLTHVRYTPHHKWTDSGDRDTGKPNLLLAGYSKKSAFNAMKKDARRYMPVLDELVYRESLWEIKTILPKSDRSDSRPILFKVNHGVKGFHCVMGGKIDNVYDVVQVIKKLRLIE
ncbi:FAD-binding oxidoreductase [Porticoccaceae bacterium]|nr:FAD-binding oxidoreductase [Porticoccaceae bacterium]